MHLIDTYLKAHDTTRYKVAKANDITPSKLQRAANHDDVDLISIRIVRYIATALNKDAGTVLNELIDIAHKNTTA